MRREERDQVGEHEVPLPTLLFAGFGAAVSWGVHFNLVYVLTTVSCKAGREGGDVAVYLVTAAFALLSGTAGWVAWRKWRMLGNTTRVADAVAKPIGRTSILLFIGMAGGALFTLFIIVEGLVPLFLRTCSLAS
jgi:TRAP-type C4-dicarboxylate transport system permease small subunit